MIGVEGGEVFVEFLQVGSEDAAGRRSGRREPFGDNLGDGPQALRVEPEVRVGRHQLRLRARRPLRSGVCEVEVGSVGDVERPVRRLAGDRLVDSRLEALQVDHQVGVGEARDVPWG
jgi:hypothetical protein